MSNSTERNFIRTPSVLTKSSAAASSTPPTKLLINHGKPNYTIKKSPKAAKFTTTTNLDDEFQKAHNDILNGNHIKKLHHHSPTLPGKPNTSGEQTLPGVNMFGTIKLKKVISSNGTSNGSHSNVTGFHQEKDVEMENRSLTVREAKALLTIQKENHTNNGNFNHNNKRNIQNSKLNGKLFQTSASTEKLDEKIQQHFPVKNEFNSSPVAPPSTPISPSMTDKVAPIFPDNDGLNSVAVTKPEIKEKPADLIKNHPIGIVSPSDLNVQPNFETKQIVSFAKDLSMTPNRYPDTVLSSQTVDRPLSPEDELLVKEMTKIKFEIDPNGDSIIPIVKNEF